ncbi:MAG: acetyl-CoA hydrolase/transferase family protein [Cytophagales bacterium]|nr:MAG: acetyl-CoA hydrolase/transferase family protein [Cytophagales bacterium]
MKNHQLQLVTAEEAVKLVESNHNIFIHSVAAPPLSLIQALVNRADELKNVQINHLHVEGDLPYFEEQYAQNFRVNNLFVGANARKAVQEGRADYTPVFLSEIPSLFQSRTIALDVVFLQLSLPDKHGYCSFGTSVDVSLSASQSTKYIIAEINPQMPRTWGDGIIHISQIDKIVEVDRPLPTHANPVPTEIEQKIGNYIAELVEDRATLQMGIGVIPDAALASLTNHKDLGVHTEMFSDGLIPLLESGVVTNKYKKKHRGRVVAGFVLGTKKLYDYIDDNPLIRMLDIEYVNDASVIKQNPRATAINSAVEVDLTGQVCADSIGSKIYSGVGGQMDFMRGAALSEGGKPIIALPSATSKGESKIVSFLKQGAGVVTTRAHVHYVITEYGIAELHGQNIRNRAKALIKIAHPQHRERLEKEAKQVGWL